MHPTGLEFYHTPDKRTQPDFSTQGFSSPTAKPWQQLETSGFFPKKLAQSQHRTHSQPSTPIEQKLAWFENRSQQLKAYIDSTSKIDQSRVREIFGWGPEGTQREGESRQMLKELSNKVRALIRENYELRGGSPTEEVATLRRQKERLQATIELLKKGEWARENILSEQNQYLREYINRKKDREIKHQINQNANILQNTQLTFTFQPTEGQVTNLRKYIMTYINTVIESNDEKLEAQEKYLRALEKRVAQLTKYDQILAHHRFQKTVKLQDSNRKSKNFTTAAPVHSGDHQATYDIEPEPQPPIKQQRYFKGKSQKSPKETTADQQSGKQMALLVLRSAQLQEELALLQQKYQCEIENHIRDSSDKEELIITTQRLVAEKTDLRHELTALRDQLANSQKGTSRFEKGMGKLCDGKELSIKQQVADIRKQLLQCGIAPFQTLQRQLSALISQRDLLQRELQNAQSSRQTKFSTLYKEIFLLKEKNAQLEQSCRFYQGQIEQYEQQLREINQKDETWLARAISRDFKEMELREDLSGFQWPRKAHECMLNSIARLENIQRQLDANQNS